MKEIEYGDNLFFGNIVSNLVLSFMHKMKKYSKLGRKSQAYFFKHQELGSVELVHLIRQKSENLFT